MELTQISHDPYARTEVLRSTVPAEDRGQCDNCGQPNGRFIYYTQNDGISTKPQRLKGAFCNIQCMRDYHTFD